MEIPDNTGIARGDSALAEGQKCRRPSSGKV
jgi:hypothetical protein